MVWDENTELEKIGNSFGMKILERDEDDKDEL